MQKDCTIWKGHTCWSCLYAYQEMVQRRATGANVHRLNNVLMQVAEACQHEDRSRYMAALRRFLDDMSEMMR